MGKSRHAPQRVRRPAKAAAAATLVPLTESRRFRTDIRIAPGAESKPLSWPARLADTTTLFSLLVVAAALFRVIGFRSPTSAVTFPDSACFTQTAEQSVFSSGFYFALRPFFVPLFYKMCGNTEAAIIIAQTLLAIVTRSLLAFAVFRVLGRSAAGVAGAALVLAFGYAHPAAAWDQIVLSESVTFSLQCLLAAMLLLAAHGIAEPVERKRVSLKVSVGLVVVTALAFGFTRDSNIYTVQLLIPLGALGTWCLRRGQGAWKLIAAATVAVVVIALVQSHMMAHSKRWHYPFFNLLGQRILRSEPLLQHFSSAGMPISPELMKFAGKWGHEDGYGIYGAPGIMPWVEKHAVSTYKSFLISNPAYTLAPAWKDLDRSLRYSVRDKTVGLEPTQPHWFAPLGAWMHPVGAGVVRLTLLLLVLGTAAAVVQRDKTLLALLVVSAWLVSVSFVQVMINYHGDAMEVGRHILPAVFGFRMALWVTVALVLHQTLRFMRSPGRSPPPAHR